MFTKSNHIKPGIENKVTNQQRDMNGIICMARIDFKCPFCHKQYKDDNGMYCDRINKNKKFYTTVNCGCGNSFKLTANYKSELVTFW
jgi:hypothetical protein